MFLRNAMLILLVLAVIFVGFALYSNIVSGDCQTSNKCASPFDTLAIINKSSHYAYLSIQNYTVLAFVVISFFVFQGFRYTSRKLEDECDDIIDSPSDYAIILRRLPK